MLDSRTLPALTCGYLKHQQQILTPAATLMSGQPTAKRRKKPSVSDSSGCLKDRSRQILSRAYSSTSDQSSYGHPQATYAHLHPP